MVRPNAARVGIRDFITRVSPMIRELVDRGIYVRFPIAPGALSGTVSADLARTQPMVQEPAVVSSIGRRSTSVPPLSVKLASIRRGGLASATSLVLNVARLICPGILSH